MQKHDNSEKYSRQLSGYQVFSTKNYLLQALVNLPVTVSLLEHSAFLTQHQKPLCSPLHEAFQYPQQKL